MLNISYIIMKQKELTDPAPIAIVIDPPPELPELLELLELPELPE